MLRLEASPCKDKAELFGFVLFRMEVLAQDVQETTTCKFILAISIEDHPLHASGSS